MEAMGPALLCCLSNFVFVKILQVGPQGGQALPPDRLGVPPFDELCDLAYGSRLRARSGPDENLVFVDVRRLCALRDVDNDHGSSFMVLDVNGPQGLRRQLLRKMALKSFNPPGRRLDSDHLARAGADEQGPALRVQERADGPADLLWLGSRLELDLFGVTLGEAGEEGPGCHLCLQLPWRGQ